MEEDWVVLCQALYQSIREEEWKEMQEQQKGSLQEDWHMLREDFFSAKEEQVRAFDRRSALRERLLTVWRVDSHQGLRRCEDRQSEVGAAEVSCVSLDRVDGPWPS